ncbi:MULTISPECIES: LysR substrate-binding domain-containing protein [Burkholderia]|uniref:LysR substrate-binding domain-containing protein n=1 Tax=Burkholderia TaxID=32008 RepID=UPI0002343A0E|nr:MULTISPECIES: LysR substrate-binding domain-containing protein [Burkholderia]MDP9544447.1 DNA-binding transcriptional LysR family regulator [Burkholderia cepacia]AOK37398.1 LysR family transcriptional regulator [Burkholderia cenocepacia]KWF53108.1 LysR family transcriptional regulator [Burkholderia cenocepacia]MBR8388980.1 LysR family transcriptional regulator [Burkholderia cenocepacia]MBR8468252.1 LysR family transcriptional regulator [Burkholderia cenocepacia]
MLDITGIKSHEMLDLDDLRLVRAIGTSRSLAAAARLLDLTPPAVTIRLQRMEARLNARLAVRQPKGIALTDEGQRLYQEAVGILERVEALPGSLAGDHGDVQGTLRVVAPLGFGRKYVARIVRDLQRAHPKLDISLHLSESPLTSAAGADVVVHVGSLKSSSWIGYPLAPNERFLCASPAYARRLNDLKHPSDLTRYDCLCLRENDEDIPRWRFSPGSGIEGESRRATVIRVSGALSSNDGTVITEWALAGLGIVERSEWDVAPLLANGKLVRLLPGWNLPAAPVTALLPSRTGRSARQRVFLDAAQRFLDPPPWRGKA